MKFKRIITLFLSICLLVSLGSFSMADESVDTLISFDDFSQHFPAGSYTFDNGILKMGEGNLFSTTIINEGFYTISFQATVDDYAANDDKILEICINIGTANDHHRFFVKDRERNVHPRQAYTKHAEIKNGVIATQSADYPIGESFVAGEYFDIRIEVQNTKAYIYVNDILMQEIVSDMSFIGSVGVRGKYASFKNFKITREKAISLIDAESFASDKSFYNVFPKQANDVFLNNILTMSNLGHTNLFSKNTVDSDQYTILVKATTNSFNPGDIVEMCINIGESVQNQHRFMVKDKGIERQQVPRPAYASYRRIINGVVDESYTTPEKTIEDGQLANGYWFDIRIVCDNNTAYMYVNGVHYETIESTNGFKGIIGFRGKGISVKDFYVLSGLVFPEELSYSGSQIRTVLVPYKDKDNIIHNEDGRQGLRFCFELPDIGQTISYGDKTYTVQSQGALVVLEDKMLAGQEMTLGSYEGILVQDELIIYRENDTDYKSAYIYNIPEEHKDTIVAVRAYILCKDEDGNQLYLYSAIQKKSVTHVFNNMDQSSLTEEVKQWWIG